ncbi:MAG: hypothetical protein M3Y34_07595 [Actinomycetota bacterium]|nr:hypothetical protein [Actinomycetota bacterium]
MSIRILERAAVFSLAAGHVSLVAAVVLLLVPDGFSRAAEVSRVRATLAKAQVLRGESRAVDDRFDTLVEGLVAGIGSGTPREIAADLDHVKTARSLERALGRRTTETEHSIDGALFRANEALSTLANGRPLVDVTARARNAGTAAAGLIIALVLLSSGAALAVRALAVRRADLVSIAERLRIPASHALDGSLGEEVTVYTITRSRRVLHETAGTAVTFPSSAPCVSIPTAAVDPPHCPQAAKEARASNRTILSSPAQAEDMPSIPLSPRRYLIDVEPLSRGRDV